MKGLLIALAMALASLPFAYAQQASKTAGPQDKPQQVVQAGSTTVQVAQAEIGAAAATGAAAGGISAATVAGIAAAVAFVVVVGGGGGSGDVACPVSTCGGPPTTTGTPGTR